MKKIFFIIFFLNSVVFSDVREAVDLDNLDGFLWSQGDRELMFYTYREYRRASRDPFYTVRYRILRKGKDEEIYEKGHAQMKFAWREELPYMLEGVPGTNYFYSLTLNSDKKSPRTTTLRMIFEGHTVIPVGFEEIKTKKIWRHTGRKL